MSFEFGMKGYTFGMIALICVVAGFFLSLLGAGSLSSIVGLAGLVCAILAFTNGKKELVADPANKKAKTGKTIGLTLIIIQIVLLIISVILMVIGVSLLGSMM